MRLRCAAAVLLALSSAVGGCDGFVRARGIIRDAHGSPVGRARIQLTDMEQYWRTESRSDGCFDVGGATGWDRYEPLTVEVPGYKPVTMRVRTAGTDNVSSSQWCLSIPRRKAERNTSGSATVWHLFSVVGRTKRALQVGGTTPRRLP